jgi:hypothetical protein
VPWLVSSGGGSGGGDGSATAVVVVVAAVVIGGWWWRHGVSASQWLVRQCGHSTRRCRPPTKKTGFGGKARPGGDVSSTRFPLRIYAPSSGRQQTWGRARLVLSSVRFFVPSGFCFKTRKKKPGKQIAVRVFRAPFFLIDRALPYPGAHGVPDHHRTYCNELGGARRGRQSPQISTGGAAAPAPCALAGQ